MRLQGDIAREAFAIGQRQRLGQPRRRVVRGRDVTDLSFSDERVERAERLFERRLRIVRMRVVQIDPIDAQTP